MKICLDTNAYTEFKKGSSALTNLIETANEIFIPIAVLGELFAGFYLGSKTQHNVAELNEFLDLPGVPLVEANRDIAHRYGLLVRDLSKKGTPIPTNDVWIAASTFETGSHLVSYDRHFDKIPGLVILSP